MQEFFYKNKIFIHVSTIKIVETTVVSSNTYNLYAEKYY